MFSGDRNAIPPPICITVMYDNIEYYKKHIYTNTINIL